MIHTHNSQPSPSNHHLGLIAAVLLLLTSATFSCQNKNSFTLEGTLENGADKTLYIEELTPDGPEFLDSIYLDKNGHFIFSKKMKYQTFYNLHTNDIDYVVLLPEKGEHITLTGDYRSLQWSYEVEGSYGSMLLWQIQDFSNYGISALTDIMAKDSENRKRYGDDSVAYKNAKEETDSIFREALTEQTDYITKFLQDNKGSLASLIALYKQFNRHEIISPEVNFDYYELVLEGLEESCADNPHTIHFKNIVERLRHQFGQPKQALDLVFDGE